MAISSRRPLPRPRPRTRTRIAEALTIAALVVAVHAGCAARSRHVAPSAAPPTAERSDARPPEGQGARSGEEEIRLPGQDRWLPSEDPRNRPAGGGRTTIIMPQPMTIGPPATTAPDQKDEPSYAVQVLASTTTTRAFALRAELEQALGIPVVVDAEDGIWKVRLGREAQRDAAEELRRRLVGMGYEDAFVVFRERR